MSELAKRHRSDLVPDKEIVIKEENAVVYEIEETDFMYDSAPHEVQVEITKSNDIYEEEEVLPNLIGLVKNSPCSCVQQGPRLHRRWDRSRKMNYDRNGFVIGKISQKDFDSYKWGILLKTRNGFDQNMPMVMRECKCCHKLEMFGKLDIVMLQLCKMYMNELDAKTDLRNGGYVVEDVATGEMAPADELFRLLIGNKEGGAMNGTGKKGKKGNSNTKGD